MALGQAVLVASEAAPGLPQRVWAEMDYLLDMCHVTKADTQTTYEVCKKANLQTFSFHL
jgi:hypothetical protein